jgi:hypothetical protein
MDARSGKLQPVKRPGVYVFVSVAEVPFLAAKSKSFCDEAGNVRPGN